MTDVAMTDAPTGDEEPVAPVDTAEFKDPEKIVIVRDNGKTD